MHCRTKLGYSDDYTGHYVLLLKYDSYEDCFYYYNPASDSGISHILLLLPSLTCFCVFTGLQKISSRWFEYARKHPATDEDIIFCQRVCRRDEDGAMLSLNNE
jgi:hypothetical protein